MSSDDDPRLDNPVYAALSTVHARFAVRNGRAMRYPEDVAPFLGLPSAPVREDWDDAAELVTPRTVAAIIDTGSPPPDGWRTTMSFDVVQMVGADTNGAHDPEAVPLGADDVPEMLELVSVTEPGPFFERTIELGDYIGIRRAGELVAMAGERLHLDGWTEISAVCTAPAHRGQGLASRLVSMLVAGIRGRSERPFLHVVADNASAIGVYEAVGFRVRRTATIPVVAPVRHAA
jgi:ribosomal protein S18 acetylase RimI-like enzyme